MIHILIIKLFEYVTEHKVWKRFGKLFKRAEKKPKGDIVQALPKFFDPKTVNRWVLKLDGVDAYLVRSVSAPFIRPPEPVAPPMVIMGSFTTTSTEPIKHDPIVEVKLYNTLDGGAMNSSLQDWVFDPKPRAGKLQFLGPTGVADETWTFNAIPMSVTFSDLDYAEADPLMTILKILLTDFTIGTPQ